MSSPFSDRIQRLRSSMHTAGLDTLILSSDAALRRLTGMAFPAEAPPAMLVLSPSDTSLLLPEIGREHPACDILVPTFYTTPEELLSLISPLLSGQIAAEKAHLPCTWAEQICRRSKAGTLIDAEPLLSRLRMIKDEQELSHLAEACRRTDRILSRWQQYLCPGTTEQALRDRLFDISRQEGVLESCPGILIASGLNSSAPHSLAFPRRLQWGDVIYIDCGARWEGYYCDITRTFFLGEPEAEALSVYRIVQQAQAAAIAAVQPGRPLYEVDRAARAVIEAAGYGPYFPHRTGHGLGLAVHEAPSVGSDSQQLMEPGMVITIEPGIYLPGRWGVRIEDDVVVEVSGVRVLNTFPKGLENMILHP